MSLPSLYPYQKYGIKWLARRNGAYLCDDMGLGKTPQAILAAVEANAQHILVICPAVARPMWVHEWKRWAGRKAVECVKRSDPLPYSGIAVVSYDYATAHAADLGRWCLVIFDEAHLLKTVDTKRSQNLLGGKWLGDAGKVWFLTGTPAPNHAGELWLVLNALGVTTLSYSQWIDTYCHSGEGTHGFQIFGTNKEKIPELHRLLKTCGRFLRRTKAGVGVQLPPIAYHDLIVEGTLPDEEVMLIHFPKWTFPFNRLPELDEELKRERMAMDAILGLQQNDADTSKTDAILASIQSQAKSLMTLRRWTAALKVKAIAEIVRQELRAKAYKKIVIFCLYRVGIECLRQELEEFAPITLYGGTPAKRREKNLKRFKTYWKHRVFLGNILACGTAIDLTCASEILFLEQDFVPGNNAQALMRVHRLTQAHPVRARFVALANSYDQKLAAILRKKTADIAGFVDGQHHSSAAGAARGTATTFTPVVPADTRVDPWS